MQHQVAALDIGTIVDNKYRVLSICGSGAYGTVYEALHQELDRFVALKMLRSSLHDSHAIRRMRREAEILSSLQHRNLPVYYGFGVWEDCPYIAMQWLEGNSLQSILDNGRLSIRTTLPIMQQVCAGLAHAHELGIIHRDVKPSNIFIPEQRDAGDAKVIDFGLSKSVAGSDRDVQKLTATGQPLGTAEYMSPEQCQGLTATAVSDIYSLGCIFYECLCGSPPFRADGVLAVMMMHVGGSTSPLRAERQEHNDIVAECQSIIDLCMAKDTAARLQSCHALSERLTELERALKQRGLSDSDFYAKVLPKNINALASSFDSERRSKRKGTRKWTPIKPMRLGWLVAAALCVAVVIVASAIRNSGSYSKGKTATSPEHIQALTTEYKTATLPQRISIARKLVPAYEKAGLHDQVKPIVRELGNDFVSWWKVTSKVPGQERAIIAVAKNYYDLLSTVSESDEQLLRAEITLVRTYQALYSRKMTNTKMRRTLCIGLRSIVPISSRRTTVQKSCAGIKRVCSIVFLR